MKTLLRDADCRVNFSQEWDYELRSNEGQKYVSLAVYDQRRGNQNRSVTWKYLPIKFLRRIDNVRPCHFKTYAKTLYQEKVSTRETRTL